MDSDGVSAEERFKAIRERLASEDEIWYSGEAFADMAFLLDYAAQVEAERDALRDELANTTPLTCGDCCCRHGYVNHGCCMHDKARELLAASGASSDGGET